MPAEWAPHERTLMAWPCRRELWGDLLAEAKRQYAGVANAVAAFEPLTMVVQSAADAAEAGAALTGEVEIVELPIDDSWLRDSGPMFVTGPGASGPACTSASTPGARSSRPTTAMLRSAACSSTTSAIPATPRRSCSRAARSASTARAR